MQKRRGRFSVFDLKEESFVACLTEKGREFQMMGHKLSSSYSGPETADTCSVGQVVRGQYPERRLREVDEARLHDPDLPSWLALPARSQSGLRIPHDSDGIRTHDHLLCIATHHAMASTLSVYVCLF